MTLLERTKARLHELGITPKKSLGQNFLISDRAVGLINEAAANLSPCQIVEVGPGLGALTDPLREGPWPFQAIELDRSLAAFWRAQGVGIIEDDALKVKWEKLSLPAGTVLVSNLPYQISTHIVVDRCLGPNEITGMVLMFQKEVAERFLALPRSKDYGLLSVMAQTFWQIEKLCALSPQDFWPAPKVASVVLVFRRQVPSFAQAPGFLRMLKVAFAHRRKFLVKNLQGHGAIRSPEEARELLARLKVKPQARAEELSVSQFQELWQMMSHGN